MDTCPKCNALLIKRNGRVVCARETCDYGKTKPKDRPKPPES